MSDTSSPVVAEVVRGGLVEGVHHGRVVAVGPDGDVRWSLGDVEAPMLPRSCHKPLQATGMLEAGLELDGRLLALASASHSGEPFHVAAVDALLRRSGLDRDALRLAPGLPLDDVARSAHLRAGGEPEPVLADCSGKHAAMLATCVARGWPLGTYLDADHPLQQALAATVARLTGTPVELTTVDGCGAPLFSTSLAGLARAFGRIAAASPGSPEGRVSAAVRGWPEHVSGSRRDEARLLAALPGAVAKAGAEACYAVGLPDGSAVALKIDDGGARARPVVMAAALRRVGVGSAAVAATGEAPVLGGGRPVGEVRATSAVRGPERV